MRTFRSAFSATDTGHLSYGYSIPNRVMDDDVFWGDHNIPIHERYGQIVVSNISSKAKVIFVFNDENITHFQIARETNLAKSGIKYPCSAEITETLKEQVYDTVWFELEGEYLYVYMEPEDYMEMILKI